jgi:hypothetical protein
MAEKIGAGTRRSIPALHISHNKECRAAHLLRSFCIYAYLRSEAPEQVTKQ